MRIIRIKLMGPVTEYWKIVFIGKGVKLTTGGRVWVECTKKELDKHVHKTKFVL